MDSAVTVYLQSLGVRECQGAAIRVVISPSTASSLCRCEESNLRRRDER